VDAEGYFYVGLQNKVVTFYFKIELHLDDIEILHQICKTLGIGKVYTYISKDKNRNSAFFMVGNFKEIVEVLIPIFHQFPLQTSKYFDFISFSEAVLIKLECTKGLAKSEKLKATDLNKIKNLKATMNSKRLSLDKEDYLRAKVSINK
jgi:hypothetical protein